MQWCWYFYHRLPTKYSSTLQTYIKYLLKHNYTTKAYSNARLLKEIFTVILNLDRTVNHGIITLTLSHIYLFIYHAIYNSFWWISLSNV